MFGVQAHAEASGVFVFFVRNDERTDDVANEMISYYKSLYSILQEFDIEIDKQT